MASEDIFGVSAAGAMGALALLLLWAGPACAINFALGAGEERCISETLMPKALLTGGWRITGGGAPAPSGNLRASSEEASQPPSPPLPPATPALALNTTLRVLSVGGDTLFESTAGAGHFSVTAVDNGEHRICVRADGGAVHASLDVKTAVEVADHTLAARPEHVAAVRARQPQQRRARRPSSLSPADRGPVHPHTRSWAGLFPAK
jgi:hypothetical protein